jgi:hypothetical protein
MAIFSPRQPPSAPIFAEPPAKEGFSPRQKYFAAAEIFAEPIFSPRHITSVIDAAFLIFSAL